MVKSVLEFGAYGDGVRDDYKSFQKAFDSGADEIIIPQGIYAISKTLKVSSNTTIIADKTAKIIMKSTERRKRNEFLLSNSDVLNGNKNIKITGGIWDGNNTAPENAKPDLFDKEGYSGAMLNFVNVDGLYLKDMVLANSVTFYVRMSMIHNFLIENIDFVSDQPGANQDGLHFGGDVKHGQVKNIRALSYGQTTDDMIALNADDSIERVENLDLCRDTIEDITFENIYAENCHTIIRMLSVTAEIKNIRFKNIYAGFRCNAINADAARYCRTPLFDDVEYPDGVGKISNIYFENFACFPALENFATVALRLESNMDNFNISGFNFMCADTEKCPAIKALNLSKQEFFVDGEKSFLNNKGETLTIKDFKNITINRNGVPLI